jgi:hypothetical protein
MYPGDAAYIVGTCIDITELSAERQTSQEETSGGTGDMRVISHLGIFFKARTRSGANGFFELKTNGLFRILP